MDWAVSFYLPRGPGKDTPVVRVAGLASLLADPSCQPQVGRV